MSLGRFSVKQANINHLVFKTKALERIIYENEFQVNIGKNNTKACKIITNDPEK